MVKVGPGVAAREATVIGFDLTRGTMRVKLNLAQSDVIPDAQSEKSVSIPASWTGPNGEFSGGCPVIGSNIWVVLGESGQWAALPYTPSNDAFTNNTSFTLSSHRKNQMSALRSGRYLTQVQNNIRQFFDPNIGIQTGNPEFFTHNDPERSIHSLKFSNEFSFTDSHLKVNGPVKRDLVSNSNRGTTGSALSSHSYDDSLFTIGLDPRTKTGSTVNRNPPFVEDREVVYEFSESFEYTNDADEADRYDTNEEPEVNTKFSRRDTRADAMSLSLSAPNQLMETIKGTAVDIFGNILDINRNILPNGRIDKLSFRTTENNKSETFLNLRDQTRKSIAYHFEINTRKSTITPDVTKNDNYARDRSRFFIDIDKEGQLKMNIPASSETGNIPLLTRYENYSTILAAEEDGVDPNEFIRNVNNQDIFAEGFGVQSISLKGGDDDLNGFVSPIDRFSESEIRVGTAYHDILNTVELHSRNDMIESFYSDSTLLDVPLLENVVSDEIIVSGESANAGGRSAGINFDGMISLNVGANTVDRQSLHFDYAGGLVGNIGRDKNGNSYAVTMDGNLLIQLGAATVNNDSRFSDLDNGIKPASLDIRVLSGPDSETAGGTCTVIRVDNTGVRVLTPGRCEIVSEQDMRFKSIRGNMLFDAESIFFYADEAGRGRLIERKTNRTI